MSVANIAQLNSNEVAQWLKTNLANKGTIRARAQLATSFARLAVDGETLVDLALCKKGQKFRMGSYGVPPSLRQPLIEAVKATKASRKGRGRPKFVGKRTIAINHGDKEKVRDSPMALARKEAKSKRTDNKSALRKGMPKVEFFFPAKKQATASPAKKASPAKRIPGGTIDYLAQTKRDFSSMTSCEVSAWLQLSLASHATTKRAVDRLAAQLRRHKVSGRTLASVATTKGSKQRNYRLASYGVPPALRSKLVKAVRAVLPEADLSSKKSSNTIKCPNGKTVRNSAVAIAKSMARSQRKARSSGFKIGCPISIKTEEGKGGFKKATYLSVSEFSDQQYRSSVTKWNTTLFCVRYADGSEFFVSKDQVVNGVAPVVTGQKDNGSGAEYLPWDGEVHAKAKDAPKRPTQPTALPALEDQTVAQMSTFLTDRIPGRGGKRVASILKRQGVSPKKLYELGQDKKSRNAKLAALGVPYCLRRPLIKAVLEKAGPLKKVVDLIKEFSPEIAKSHIESLVKSSTKSEDTILIDGKKVRNSTVAIAKHMALKEGKKAYKVGFPDFEWVTKGGFAPVSAMNTSDLVGWAKKTFAGETLLKSLVRSLKRNQVDGERLAQISFTKKGRNARFQAIGVPRSLRRKLTSAVKSGSPTYSVAKSSANTVKCPDGVVVRDSTVSIAKHMRWQTKGYAPKPRFHIPEFQVQAKAAPLKRYKKTQKTKKESALPKDRKSVRKVDAQGWPAVEIKVSSRHTAVSSSDRFVDMDTEQTCMWAREQLSGTVGIKVLVASLRKNGATGRSLAPLGSKKSRNAIMAALGAPFSTRKALVSSVKAALKDSKAAAKKSKGYPAFNGTGTVVIPGTKKAVRDSPVSIAKYYARRAAKKKSATSFNKTGFPSVVFVSKSQERDGDSKKLAQSTTQKQTASWAAQVLKGQASASSATRAIRKFKIAGSSMSSIAHDKKSGQWRMGMYGIPRSARAQLTRTARSEVAFEATPKKRTHITVDGQKIRNSSIALFLHQHNKAKAALGPEEKLDAASIKKSCQSCRADLLEMSPEELGRFMASTLPLTGPHKAMFAKSFAKRKVTGRMICDLASKKEGRAARLSLMGVPAKARKAFVRAARKSVPPQYKPAGRKYYGQGTVTLWNEKKTSVRDSPLAIARQIARRSKTQRASLKRVDANGWSEAVTVFEKKERKAEAPSKKIDLSKASVQQVYDWAKASFQNGTCIASRFASLNVSGSDLAKLVRDRSSRTARMSMWGVPAKQRSELMRLLKRDIKAARTEPAKSTRWFDSNGKSTRKTVASVAVYKFLQKKKTTQKEDLSSITVTSAEADVLGLRHMDAAQVSLWLQEVLAPFANSKALAARLRKLNVSGEALRRMVGSSSKGRTSRLSAHGVPKSLRKPLTRAVRASQESAYTEKKSRPATIKCPDGTVIRNSSIAFARHEAKKSKKQQGGFPTVVFAQSSRPPVVALRSEDMAAFVERLFKGSAGAKTLSKNLTKFRVTGEQLIDACRTRTDRNTRLNAIGVPYNLRKQLITAVKEDLRKDQRSGEPAQIPSWVGRKVFHINRDTIIRDSAVSVAQHLGTAGKSKEELKKHFFPEVVCVFEKAAKAAPKTKGDYKLFTTDKVAAWVEEHLDASKGYKKTIAKALSEAKFDGARLHLLGSNKSKRNARLNSLGVPHGAKAALVHAIRKFFKGQAVEAAEAKSKKAESELIKAFRAATKSKKFTWPDMELSHKVKAPKGGFQVEKSVIKAQDLERYLESAGEEMTPQQSDTAATPKAATPPTTTATNSTPPAFSTPHKSPSKSMPSKGAPRSAKRSGPLARRWEARQAGMAQAAAAKKNTKEAAVGKPAGGPLDAEAERSQRSVHA